jgi:hypothetical protein
MPTLFHVCFDAADERRDVTAAEVFGDVDAGENPHLARADVGDKELSHRGNTGIREKECTNSVLVAWWDRLAVQEIVILPDKPRAFSDEYERDEHLSHCLRY